MKKLRSFVPHMDIVGLHDAVVQESKQHVQAVIKNTGFEYPRQCIVVNLAEALQYRPKVMLE